MSLYEVWSVNNIKESKEKEKSCVQITAVQEENVTGPLQEGGGYSSSTRDRI